MVSGYTFRSELKILTSIGTGQYGAIKLVVPAKDTMSRYALKVIDRSNFRTKRQENLVMNEKLIMQALDHPFHLKLINTYKTATKLYILVPYLPGGDLFARIHQELYEHGDYNTAISQSAQKFYVANILLALKHMHEHGVIHRDIKSANLLIKSNGYIQVRLPLVYIWALLSHTPLNRSATLDSLAS